LLEILSQTRNPHAVQDHLRKCFENINRIDFTKEEESKEIVGMISAEPVTFDIIFLNQIFLKNINFF